MSNNEGKRLLADWLHESAVRVLTMSFIVQHFFWYSVAWLYTNPLPPVGTSLHF